MAATVAQQRSQRDQLVEKVVREAHTLVTSLRGLKPSERSAVVTLVAAAQMMSAYERSRNRPDPGLIKGFTGAIANLSPEAAQVVGFGWARGCRDESVAYASAMAKCLKDDKKTEDQCDRENASEAAAELGCMMKQFEAFMKQLQQVIHGPRPGPQPGPGPLPV